MNSNGVWFYGLSGSGKTFVSKLIKKRIKNSILVDGDTVRKYISTDLDYSIKSRNIQIKRIFGISKIIIMSKFYPIISSVWMNEDILKKCKTENILVLKIIRDMEDVFHSHRTYVNNKINIVGKDLKYKNIKTKVIKNNKKEDLLVNIDRILL
tara:strand:+ start:230 stop:688 length:459 start_codon:yes stop_codon:yes gene_type:complete